MYTKEEIEIWMANLEAKLEQAESLWERAAIKIRLAKLQILLNTIEEQENEI